MKVGSGLSILSHALNIIIFIYFSLILIKINALDMAGLSVTAFGLLMSLIANIISVLED